MDVCTRLSTTVVAPRPSPAGPEPADSLEPVADDHLWTAEELEKLTPQERQRLLDERVVTDLSSLAPDLVARIRQRGRTLMEQRGTSSRTVEGG
jgi:hypothetical protein